VRGPCSSFPIPMSLVPPSFPLFSPCRLSCPCAWYAPSPSPSLSWSWSWSWSLHPPIHPASSCSQQRWGVLGCGSGCSPRASRPRRASLPHASGPVVPSSLSLVLPVSTPRAVPISRVGTLPPMRPSDLYPLYPCEDKIRKLYFLIDSRSWRRFGVLLCWQTWASFGYRAGSVATWWGNGSIPGGCPPPGVSRCPSYAIHCSYVVVVCTSSSFGPSFVVVCRLSSFVRRCRSYVIVRMSLSFGPLYVVVHCSLSFVHCRTLFIHRCSYVVVCCLYVIIHCSYIVVRMSLYVVHTSSYAVHLCTLSYIVRRPSYVVPVAMYLEI
jgi:hypothetical protein